MRGLLRFLVVTVVLLTVPAALADTVKVSVLDSNNKGVSGAKVEVKDANSPAIVTGDSHNPIIVIMPMRL